MDYQILFFRNITAKSGVNYQIQLLRKGKCINEKKDMSNSQHARRIQGEIQLAVGNYVIEIGDAVGSVVSIQRPETHIGLIRSTSVFLPPPGFDHLLGRNETMKSAIAALQSGQSVEFYGKSGIGKTVLLHCLAYETQVKSAFRDGVISLELLHPQKGDLLQCLYAAFYESNPNELLTNTQIRQLLQGKQALILLDDHHMRGREIAELMTIAADCTFILASPISRLSDKRYSFSLSGLCVEDAVALIERKLQKSLSDELADVRTICTTFKGHPMHLLLAAASVRDSLLTFAQIVSITGSPTPAKSLIVEIVESLPRRQRCILDVLLVMGDVGLRGHQITAITELPDAVGMLERLRRLFLIQVDGFRYRLSNTIIEALPPLQLTATLEKAVAYFISWAQNPNQSQIESEIDAIVEVLGTAVKVGLRHEALCLVKVVESAIALHKRWDLWEQVLLQGLQAAEAEKDLAAVAWVWHQLGTRALCLEDQTSAITYLTKALKLRKSLADEPGIAVTSHNLSLITATDQTTVQPTNSDIQELPSTPPKRSFSLSLTGTIAAIIFATCGFFAWFTWNRATSKPAVSFTAPQTAIPTSKSPIPVIPSPKIQVTTSPATIPSLKIQATPKLIPSTKSTQKARRTSITPKSERIKDAPKSKSKSKK